MKPYALLIWLSMFTAIVYAQECTITVSGIVLDLATREPLESTTVELQEYKLGALADSTGRFVFQRVCPGPVHINFHHIGCPSEGIFLTIRRDTFITFFLEHHGALLREIQIEGQPEGTANVEQVVSKSSILLERPAASLAEITSTIAGVTLICNGAGISKPVIHGLYGNRVAVINNGVVQAGQQWGTDHAPEIDPNVAGQISIVKGSDAIEYGSQALGGAIKVDPGIIPQDPHLHGDVIYGVETNGRKHSLAFIGTRTFSKLDVKVVAGISRAGDHKAPAYFLTNTGSRESSGAVQAILRASENMHHHFFYSLYNTEPGIFAGSHISNLSDLEQAIQSDVPFNIEDAFSYTIAPPKQRVTHHLWKYGGKRFVNQTTNWQWLYAGQFNHRQEFDIRRGDRSSIPALDLKLWSHTIELKSVTEGDHTRSKSGLQIRLTDNYNSFDTGVLPLIPDYKEGVAGVFTSFESTHARLSWNAGIRYDVHVMRAWAITPDVPHAIDVRNHTDHEGALAAGLKFTPDDHWQTRLHIVGAQRSPAANERYSFGLHQGIAGIEEGNWLLVPETSVKAIVDQKISIDHLAHVFITAYAHSISDFIYLQPSPELRLTIRGAFPVYRYAQDDAWLRGLDLLVVSDFSHRLEWTGKASFIRGTRTADGSNLASMPPSQFTSSLSWTVKDSRRWKSVKLKVDASYTGRQRHWDELAELVAPPGDYWLLNVGFSTGFLAGEKMIHGSLVIENLLNQRYRNYLNRLRYFADEEGRNVSLALRYQF